MSRDNLFLEKNWTKVKKSIEYLISEDKDQDGLLEGSQYNTLDAAWYGPMGWIVQGLILVLVAWIGAEWHDHEEKSNS